MHQCNLCMKRKLLEWRTQKCNPSFGAESSLRSTGQQTTGFHASPYRHKELEQRHDICSVFFDYCKAFDSVPHLPLLHKLQQYDVHPQLLRWLANYLTMRKQYVCVSGATSDTLPVSSGVPQGSVLGPMLFNIYINDITAVALSDGSMTLFADDMMLYRPIHTVADFRLLQTDIDKLCNWTDNNLLKFNSRKCKYMIISRKIQPPLPGTPLTVNGSLLEKVESYKYLGVWLTSSLSWSMQVSTVCKKARQKIGVMYHKFYHANTPTLLQLYKACIRPHLEYAAPVWDPHQLGLIKCLENVQKFALKVCTKSWNVDYESMLTSCNLTSLASRRRFLKLCVLYQMTHGTLNFPNTPVANRVLPAVNLRSYTPYLLYRPVAHTNAYHFSFFPDAITHWNTLPTSVLSCNSLCAFKHALTRHIHLS